jgi:hypothetical protein
MARIAGIGSRDLNDEQLNIVEKLGEWIVRCGHELHSGGAQGADQAFARGGNRVDPTRVFVHLPWLSYERNAIKLGNHVDILASMNFTEQQTYEEYAQAHHPAWDRLTNGGKLLHARNGRILFPNGYPGQSVDLVTAWPSTKLGGGGTGQGIRMAHAARIPVINLAQLVPDYSKPPMNELRIVCESIREMK